MAAGDITFLNGREAIAAIQGEQTHVGFLTYLLKETFVDELTSQKDYLAQARQGHHILNRARGRPGAGASD